MKSFENGQTYIRLAQVVEIPFYKQPWLGLNRRLFGQKQSLSLAVPKIN